jgi:hypothetical protein
MAHLYVLEFTDGLIKVGHANDPAKRVSSSAKAIAGRCGVTLTQRWASPAHEGSEMTGKRLAHWACCNGRPVSGFREVFTGVTFDQTVAAAQDIIDSHELLLAFYATTDVRQLFPGTFGYRLRHAALSSINP